MQITKTENDKAEVTLAGTLPKDDIQVYWDNALKAAMKEVSVPGFRKGHVPEERVLEEVGEDFLWKQAADMALREKVTDLLKEHEVISIMPLNLILKSAKKDVDVEFEIVAVMPPTCDAGDYKTTAASALDALPEEDSKKEKAEAVKAFRMQVRAISMMKNPEEVKEGDAKENEDKAETPLTDEEAKLAGFENGQAIEHFIEGEAEKAVKDRALQKKRGAIAEALIKEAKAKLPVVLIDEETKALVEMFKRDVVNQGMEWNDYLKRVKKDEQAVVADMRPNAEKRIILDLVFAEIIKGEKLELGEDEKKKENEIVQALVKQEVPEERAVQYAKEQLLKEKAWEALGAKSEAAV